MRIIHDITAAISEGMPVYPGDPETRIRRVAKVEEGAPANISEYSFCSHAGTHIDPPFHLDPAGMKADAVPLDALIGPAVVLEADGPLDAAFIERQNLAETDRILLKTPYSTSTRKGVFSTEPGGLDKGAAETLVRLGVRLVGIDHISVEGLSSLDFPVHRTLLDAGVVVLEGLDLSRVKPGRYELICLPLKVLDGDGAPARAVLVEYS